MNKKNFKLRKYLREIVQIRELSEKLSSFLWLQQKIY